MAKLTPEQSKSRLKLDYQVVMKMRSPLMNVTAYRNADDLKRRRNPIVSDDDGQLATHYLVDYHIRTMVGPDEYSANTSVQFDLLANGNYPYTMPGCFVISRRMPWTPHFKEGVPICIDHNLWEDSRVRMLLGDLLVHVAKLLNFDEIPRTENYGGYNPEAAHYWRTRLNGQPLTPGLPYPTLPDIVDDESSLFSAVARSAEDFFQAIPTTRVDLFQAKAVTPEPRADPLENADFIAKSPNHSS